MGKTPRKAKSTYQAQFYSATRKHAGDIISSLFTESGATQGEFV